MGCWELLTRSRPPPALTSGDRVPIPASPPVRCIAAALGSGRVTHFPLALPRTPAPARGRPPPACAPRHAGRSHVPGKQVVPSIWQKARPSQFSQRSGPGLGFRRVGLGRAGRGGSALARALHQDGDASSDRPRQGPRVPRYLLRSRSRKSSVSMPLPIVAPTRRAQRAQLDCPRPVSPGQRPVSGLSNHRIPTSLPTRPKEATAQVTPHFEQRHGRSFDSFAAEP